MKKHENQWFSDPYFKSKYGTLFGKRNMLKISQTTVKFPIAIRKIISRFVHDQNCVCKMYKIYLSLLYCIHMPAYRLQYKGNLKIMVLIKDFDYKLFLTYCTKILAFKCVDYFSKLQILRSFSQLLGSKTLSLNSKKITENRLNLNKMTCIYLPLSK